MPATEHVMELRLRNVQQLFNSLDPSPFVDRDLDQDAEEYIVGWARELPRSGPFRLLIHLDEYDPSVASRVTEAVRHFFAYRAEVTTRDFKQLLREGRLTLVIGLLFLATCLLGARYLGAVGDDHPLIEFASESLIIGGWVAMWRPLEILLYAWWPLARRRRILMRLAQMDIQLRQARG
jgi:hypothetical protein